MGGFEFSFSFGILLITMTTRLFLSFSLLDSLPLRRAKAAKAPPADDGDVGPSPHLPSGPKQDYSLKEGQTFSIKIPGAGSGRKIRDSNTTSATSGMGGFGGGPLLPPPPSRRG